MSKLTFKTFLSLSEDADADIANLNVQKQQLILRKNQSAKPIDDQIINTDKLLMQKEKQRQIEAKKKGVSPTSKEEQQQAGNKTTTPGSTGSQTPGGGSNSAVPAR